LRDKDEKVDPRKRKKKNAVNRFRNKYKEVVKEEKNPERKRKRKRGK